MHAKKGCRKGSEKYAKRLQNDAKMDAEINDFHTFSKKAKTLETICFIIENVVPGIKKCMNNLYKIDAKSMPGKTMQNDAK